MKPSNFCRRPVVTMLSSSVSAAAKSQDLLSKWTALQPIQRSPVSIATTKGVFPVKWDLLSSECSATGTVVQWLSRACIENSPGDVKRPTQQHLIMIQDKESLEDAISSLTAYIAHKSNTFLIQANALLGRSIRPIDVVGESYNPVPMFNLGEKTPTSAREPWSEGVLKELVVPLGGANIQSFLDKVYASSLHRPATGLYQFANGLCIRPLPWSTPDQKLAAPSFIFHQDNLEKSLNSAFKTEKVARIGYTGRGTGQLIVFDDTLKGLEVRLCESNSYKEMFAESEASLLGGSLEELQSVHVMNNNTGMTDPRTNNTDCWVEFRTTYLKGKDA